MPQQAMTFLEKRTKMVVNDGPMWLVYVAQDGQNHFEPWTDIMQSGTLTDPETGEDMPLVGWTTDNPAWIVHQRKPKPVVPTT